MVTTVFYSVKDEKQKILTQIELGF